MTCASFFSPDYFTARDRFRSAAERCNAKVASYRIAARGPSDQPLTIDVALLGTAQAERALVISSGMHGVEGFSGSALQLAMLDGWSSQPERLRVVLLHGLNPFGFAWGRRWNEDNADPNRNFLLPDESYQGSPPLYGHVDRWLNPPTAPSRLRPVPLAGLLDLARFGFWELFRTIPAGQFDYPHGLFYGGGQPCETHRIVADHMRQWVGSARRVIHLDLHTGLGRWKDCTLLIDGKEEQPTVKWFRQHFPGPNIRCWPTEVEQTSPGSYAPRGSWSRWCTWKFADCGYQFATVEFGTYDPLRILLALRDENRAWQSGNLDNPRYAWTRRRLLEMFSPASGAWREAVVQSGTRLIRQAAQAPPL